MIILSYLLKNNKIAVITLRNIKSIVQTYKTLKVLFKLIIIHVQLTVISLVSKVSIKQDYDLWLSSLFLAPNDQNLSCLNKLASTTN